MSTDAEAEALKTLLATATKAPVYDLDEAQALTTLPAQYTLLFLSRREGGNARLDGIRDSSGRRRLSTRVVAKTITNARLLEDRIFEAFNLATVTLAGQLAHVAYESGGGAFEYDEGWYTALTDFTYVL